MDPQTIPNFSTPRRATLILGIDRKRLGRYAEIYERHTGQLLKVKNANRKAGARLFPKEVLLKFIDAFKLMSEDPTLGFDKALKQLDLHTHRLTGEYIAPDWASQILQKLDQSLKNDEEILRLLRSIERKSEGTNIAISHLLERP